MEIEKSFTYDLPPPLAGDWRELSGSLLRLVCDRLLELGHLLPDEAATACRALPLPFYADYVLLDLQVSGNDGAIFLHSFLFGPQGPVPLTGRAGGIHALNATDSFTLGSLGAQRLYLCFFCQFTRGQAGPFTIIEDEVDLGERDWSDKVERCRFDDATGLWYATLLYDGSLFAATFEVDTAGVVQMIEDRQIAEGVAPTQPIEWGGTARWRATT